MTEDEMYDIIRGYEDSERDYHELNIELESENAKLRELVRALNWCTENFWCLDSPSNCDDCPLEQSDKLTPECEVRMRELGIEVES